MSRVLTSSKLIKSIKRRAMVPEDDRTFDDQDILDIVNEELDIGMLPRLLSLNEEHLVTFVDIPLASDKNRYRIPYRAIGNKLRDVALIDSSGSHYELSRISLEEMSDYRSSYNSSQGSGIFYIEGDEIVLVDTTLNDYESLRCYIYLRPNSLVLEEEAAVIDSIDFNTGVINLKNFPSEFSSNPQMDFIGSRTPNKTYRFDIQPTSVNSTTMSVTIALADLPSELIPGDYLCLRETSPVIQIPTEMHPVLAQRAAVHILESMSDTEALGNAQKRLEDMDMSTMSIVDDRVEGSPQKINPRHSTLNQSIMGTVRKRRGL